MIDPLTLSIAIGLALSLLFVELFGLFAGGMVVPGYIALDIVHPGTVFLTLVTSLLIFYLVRFLSKYLVIYGRRRVALTVLIAFLMGVFVRHIFFELYKHHTTSDLYTVVGYIIPGLIALSMDRQGIVETIATVITVGVAVRLFLIILIGPVLIS